MISAEYPSFVAEGRASVKAEPGSWPDTWLVMAKLLRNSARIGSYLKIAASFGMGAQGSRGFTPPRVMPPLINISCEAAIFLRATIFMSQLALLTEVWPGYNIVRRLRKSMRKPVHLN